MGSTDYAKELVARKSLDFIEDGMVVGLGTGSTATPLHQTTRGAREARAEDSRYSVIEHEQETCRIPFNPNCRFEAVSGN